MELISRSQAWLGNAFTRQAKLGAHFLSQVQLENELKMPTLQILEESSAPSFSTTLLIDAMYFYAAKKSFLVAKNALKEIGKARKYFADLRKKEAEILERYGNDSEDSPGDDSGNVSMSVYDELEPIYIQMEGAEFDIGSAYGPYMQHIALTHILCATAAEAHINVVAKGRLKGKFKDNFEKISLEGKWLFLPKILGKAGFDQGAEPFQSFSKLNKIQK